MQTPASTLLSRYATCHQSRRRFVLTFAGGLAGFLVEPFDVLQAQRGFWSSLKSYFTALGECIRFFPLAREGCSYHSFSESNLAALYPQLEPAACLGNVSKRAAGQTPSKILTLVGSRINLSAGVLYLNKNAPSNRILLPIQFVIALSSIACSILKLPDNLPKTTASIEVVKQDYFLPRWDGQFGVIAREMMQSFTPFTRSFPKPLFYESEIGVLVAATYEAQITRRDRAGRPKEGQGHLLVYTVPPGNRKNSVMEFIESNKNFWVNSAVRSEFISLMKDNVASGDNNSSSFAFSL